MPPFEPSRLSSLKAPDRPSEIEGRRLAEAGQRPALQERVTLVDADRGRPARLREAAGGRRRARRRSPRRCRRASRRCPGVALDPTVTVSFGDTRDENVTSRLPPPFFATYSSARTRAAPESPGAPARCQCGRVRRRLGRALLPVPRADVEDQRDHPEQGREKDDGEDCGLAALPAAGHSTLRGSARQAARRDHEAEQADAVWIRGSTVTSRPCSQATAATTTSSSPWSRSPAERRTCASATPAGQARDG